MSLRKEEERVALRTVEREGKDGVAIGFEIQHRARNTIKNLMMLTRSS